MARASRPTITDVARTCGLSIATVSRVLGGDDAFSPATAARVRTAAERCGYRPNASARAMLAGRFDAVGLLYPTASSDRLPHGLVEALEEALRRSGRTLLLTGLTGDPEAPLPAALTSRMMDGILLHWAAPMPPKLHALATASGLPCIAINRVLERDAVCIADREAAQEATETLLRRGRTRIAFLDLNAVEAEGHFHDSGRERWLGHRAAMTAAGLTAWRPNRVGHVQGDEGVALVRGLLQRPDRPDALVAYSMDTALTARIAAAEAGVRLGPDVALIGFGADDGLPEAAAPIARMGWKAAQEADAAIALLDRRLAGAGPQPAVRIAPRLVAGATLGAV